MDSAALTAAERQLSEARAIRLQLENRAKQALAAWQKIAIESASRTQADLDRMAAQIAAARQEAEARTLEARRIEEEESFAVILIAIASQDKLLH